MAIKRIELRASGAVTSDGQGSSKKIDTISMGMVEVDISAASGTIVLDIYLEGSSDGNNWYELPADQVLKKSGVAAAVSVTTNVRDIVDNKTTTAAEKFVAIYGRLPAGYVRISHTLSGSTPSVTYSSAIVGK